MAGFRRVDEHEARRRALLRAASPEAESARAELAARSAVGRRALASLLADLPWAPSEAVELDAMVDEVELVLNAGTDRDVADYCRSRASERLGHATGEPEDHLALASALRRAYEALAS